MKKSSRLIRNLLVLIGAAAVCISVSGCKSSITIYEGGGGAASGTDTSTATDEDSTTESEDEGTDESTEESKESDESTEESKESDESKESKETEESKESKKSGYGVVGSFNKWGNDGSHDIPMTDDDGDGVYEADVVIDKVTEDMYAEATMDNGHGEQVARDMHGITFKVRVGEDWTDSWGTYEPTYERTYNSQTNCCAECELGDSIIIHVQFDTTRNTQQAIDSGIIKASDAPNMQYYPIVYNVEKK